MSTLTKSQLVLGRVGGEGGVEVFGVEGRPDIAVTMESETWEDMGRPETITVTIEPGDRLNP